MEKQKLIVIKEIKLMYRAILIRYSFNNAIISRFKDFDLPPNETQLISFANDCNKLDGFHSGFRTEIKVESVYIIIK